jgi:hypothetical protein
LTSEDNESKYVTVGSAEAKGGTSQFPSLIEREKREYICLDREVGNILARDYHVVQRITNSFSLYISDHSGIFHAQSYVQLENGSLMARTHIVEIF